MKLRQFDIYDHTDGFEYRFRIAVEKASNGYVIRATGNVNEEVEFSRPMPLQSVAKDKLELEGRLNQEIEEWRQSVVAAFLEKLK